MTNVFSTLREWAHAGVAIIGALAFFSGGIVTFLNAVGVHVTDVQAAQWVAGIGALVAVISKGIDSANNALGSTPSAPPVA